MLNCLPVTEVVPIPPHSGPRTAGDTIRPVRRTRWLNPRTVAEIRTEDRGPESQYAWLPAAGGSPDRIDHGTRLQGAYALKANGGSERIFVEGQPGELNRYLGAYGKGGPPVSTGWTLHVTTGHYTVQGEAGGDVEVHNTDGPYHLDPNRLAGEEWHIVKPKTGSSGFGFEIVRRSAPGSLLTIEEWVLPLEPHGEGAWRPIVISPRPSAASLRLRVQP